VTYQRGAATNLVQSVTDALGLGLPHACAFEIDVLACPRCGGRLRLIAAVKDPREIREVLAGLARSAEPVALDRAPPCQASFAANPTADVCA
jgi:hypothetical protein